MEANEVRMTGANNAAGIINILAGVWLFISPWIYGYGRDMSAWNAWFIGFGIALIAAVRLAAPAQSWLSWINCVLGIWTFFTPWIYGFAGDTARLVNCLVVGVIVFVLGIASARTSVYPMHPTPPGVRA